MKLMKKVLVLTLMLALLITVAAGLFWHWQHYVMVGLKFYPRNEAVLDMRQEALSFDQFDKLQAKLPDTRIEWMVPFQDRRYPQDIQELTVEELKRADLPGLRYFAGLKTIHADACRDYENLQLLCELYPEINVEYTVRIDGTDYSPETEALCVASVTDEEMDNLQYLTKLKKVSLTGSGDVAQLGKLKKLCAEQGIAFEFTIGGEIWPENTREMTASGVSKEELQLLSFLPELTKVHLVNPTAPAAALKAAQEQHPGTEISWEVSICGRTFPWDTEEVDLSSETVTDLQQVETLMECLPKLQKLKLGRFSTPEEGRGDYAMWESPITNQDVADYRERVRDRYKVSWEVQVGRKLTARTDDTTFRPDSHGVGRLFDDEVYNLRYCEDMICIDVGHMTLSDVSWAAFMPHLKYLILAWTQVRDVSPLGNLKELIYLELDYSLVKDVSPLVGCTALEDLNLGKTYVDATPLCQMTWLKHLYMIFCPGSSGAYKVAQAVPDCVVVTNGTHTVASGWRNLPNYYAQRDALNMYYMN